MNAWGPWGARIRIENQNVSTPGTGTFVFLKTETEHAVAGFTALGERGKRAETVGREAAMELIRYYVSGAPWTSTWPIRLSSTWRCATRNPTSSSPASRSTCSPTCGSSAGSGGSATMLTVNWASGAG